MVRFVLGVVVGAVAAVWLRRAQSQGALDGRVAEMQERANALLLESRRVLEEVRQELASALESGRRSVEERAERMRWSTGQPPREEPSGGEGDQI